MVWVSGIVLASIIATCQSSLASPHDSGSCSRKNDPGGLVMRPNLYMGYKSRSSTPVSSGVLWFGDARLAKLRHEADESDGLTNWGWKLHDGLSFGKQQLTDPTLGVDLTTYFYQPGGNCSDSGAYVHLHGKSLDDSHENLNAGASSENKPVISILHYIAVEDPSAWLKLDGSPEHLTRKGMKGEISITGYDPTLGEFSIISDSPSNDDGVENNRPDKALTHLFRAKNLKGKTTAPELDGAMFAAIHVEDVRNLWKVKERVSNMLHESRHSALEIVDQFNKRAGCNQSTQDDEEEEDEVDEECLEYGRIIPVLPNTVDKNANLIVIQQVFNAPFQYGFGMVPATVVEHSDTAVERVKGVAPQVLEAFQSKFGNAINTLITRETVIENRFEHVFKMNSKFNSTMIQFARAALANCLGSHGYFYGSSIIQSPQGGGESLTMGPAGPLYTGVPSRSFFPRGFLWDEGFHQLLVSHWDPSITRDVLRHWLGRMDSRGWIAREQILGDEALSKVPAQFRVQHLDYANPPALLLAVDSIVDRLGTLAFNLQSDECASNTNHVTCESASHSQMQWLNFLLEIYPLLKRHYDWAKTTQTAQVQPNTFRWRGRSDDGQHTLTSGIDDYPRGRVHYASVEAHVDILSWMAWSAHLLSKLANTLEREIQDDTQRSRLKKDVKSLDYDYLVYTKSLEAAHWNQNEGFYFDIGVVDEIYPRQPKTQQEQQKLRVVSGHVKHIGYVGLMPFLLQIAPVDHLEPILNRIQDPDQLWSQVGLRSLSKSDYLFGKGEDYWRGKVWINLNYLALRALRHYSKQATVPQNLSLRCKAIADSLATNLINNMYQQYQTQGFLFENYLSETGLGAGTRPFTGWSALVVLIMGDNY